MPKPGTLMRNSAPCPTDDHLQAIALARLILPESVHVQAPPNLAAPADLGALLSAGIDDWGGVSPVTIDHVNPERPWPALDVLAQSTEQAGLALAPRLTIYPEFVLDPQRWLDSGAAVRGTGPVAMPRDSGATTRAPLGRSGIRLRPMSAPEQR